MDAIASEIRTNIASLQDEIKELRKSAKKDLGDCATVRTISAELRTRISRVKDLERNLVAAEEPPQDPRIPIR
jgi:hypothetical protein